MNPRIIVVGAGIGGLSAALALLRAGVSVKVYERASELKEIGAGMHLGPNGASALFGLGLKEKILAFGARSKIREARIWNTGEAWVLPNMGLDSEARYGAPYMLMHRGDLHSILLEAVRALDPQAVEVNSRCVDIRQDASGAEVVLADGRVARAEAVVGADGVHSVIREKLNKYVAPQFTGKLFWRGMVPVDLVPERERESNGGWFSPSATVTVYPVRRGELLNFVGTVKRDSWNKLSWTEQGTTEECLADFEGWHPNIITMIKNMGAPYKWGLFQFETVKEWTEGRVTLLGDACHPMPPSLGQGAIMAIEDGVILARCVAQNRQDMPAALQQYQRARVPRATKVVQYSWQESRGRNNPELADPEQARIFMANRCATEKVSDFYDWIFAYKAHEEPI